MIYLRLRNLQPTCVASEQTQGMIRRSLPYLPGSALRGALATALRTARPTIPQAEFAELILSDRVRFFNLYPVPTRYANALPLPNTARTCKIYRGFASNGGSPLRKSHGVRDLLYAYLRYQQADEDKKMAALPPQTCGYAGVCELAVEPFTTFYVDSQIGEYAATEIRLRQITQTAIDPHRETARPTSLFTVEAIEEEQEFAGYIALGSSEEEDDFCQKVIPENTFLRIGYGRTRGMGLMEVIDCHMEEATLWSDDLLTRLKQFNKTAQDNDCVKHGETLFSMTLLADTIVLDPFFRSTAHLSGALLAQEIAPPLADATCLLMFADVHQITGWSTPHGLHLPANLAITPGSTYVFRTTLPIEEVARLLATVEHRGIGERRNEGFGHVVICHPFHQEIEAV